MKVRSSRGFTVAELIVVIVVIAALATITVLAVGSWRTRTAKTEVIHALSSASSAIENYKSFNKGYPTGTPPAMPSAYDPALGVTVAYLSGTASTYCLRGTSVAVTSVVYYLTHATASPTTTACT